jgi:sensor domain CHASE-containing protein
MSNGMPGSTLQQKVSLTLVVVMAALAVLSYVTLDAVVAPAFDQLELDEARTNLIRVDRAIQNDLDYLTVTASDWGQWDDAFDYVRGENPTFESGNLARSTLANLGLNLLAFYDADDRLLWGQVEYEGEQAGVDALESLAPGTGTFEFLSGHTDPTGHISGFVRTGLGPMLMSSWPVVRSNYSGSIQGTLIMGQFLNDDRVASLRDRTEVALNWTPVNSIDDVHPALEIPLNRPGEVSVHQETNARTIISSGVVEDLFGVPIVVIEINTPRSISALGTSTVNVALVFLGLAALVVAAVTWLLLRKFIVFPLVGLSDHIVAIRKSGDLTN